MIIENPEQFRKNIVDKFKILINNDIQSINLEKSIYNWAIKESKNKNIVKKWDNIYFTLIYIDKFRSILRNITSEELKNKIISREIKSHEVAFMTNQEMRPLHWQKLLDIKQERENNRYAPKMEANTDNFTCRKCSSNKCSYYQLQTRSADEPMTTFVTCINCGNRWKC